jgi:hypothetical protein
MFELEVGKIVQVKWFLETQWCWAKWKPTKKQQSEYATQNLQENENFGRGHID